MVVVEIGGRWCIFFSKIYINIKYIYCALNGIKINDIKNTNAMIGKNLTIAIHSIINAWNSDVMKTQKNLYGFKIYVVMLF